jgi:hypothetical protein
VQQLASLFSGLSCFAVALFQESALKSSATLALSSSVITSKRRVINGGDAFGRSCRVRAGDVGSRGRCVRGFGNDSPVLARVHSQLRGEESVFVVFFYKVKQRLFLLLLRGFRW